MKTENPLPNGFGKAHHSIIVWEEKFALGPMGSEAFS